MLFPTEGRKGILRMENNLDAHPETDGLRTRVYSYALPETVGLRTRVTFWTNFPRLMVSVLRLSVYTHFPRLMVSVIAYIPALFPRLLVSVLA